MVRARQVPALLVLVAVVLAGCGGEGSISGDDIDRAERRWHADVPAAYHWRADGFVGERSVDIDLVIVDGVAENVLGSDLGAEYAVDGLFSQMRAALDDGLTVRGSLDDEFGYPTRMIIGDRLDLTTRDFIRIDRPEGCAAEPGSATDLASEPAAFLLYGAYQRWTDADGCEVRVDVIGQIDGPEHCGWETATFITVGTPIGTPHSTLYGPADHARTYIWDPQGVLSWSATCQCQLKNSLVRPPTPGSDRITHSSGSIARTQPCCIELSTASVTGTRSTNPAKSCANDRTGKRGTPQVPDWDAPYPTGPGTVLVNAGPS